MNRGNVYFVSIHYANGGADVEFYEKLSSAIEWADYYASIGYQVTVEIDCGF